MADQMGARHVGCYGSGVPSTPTLDRLAARGVRFDRCYANSPVCCPSRATLLTGRSPVVHGMIANNYTLPPDTPTYAHLLSSCGYHIGGFGKFHHCPMPLDHPADYSYLGFHESLITEDPKWGPYIEWIRTDHPEWFETALAVAWGVPRSRPPYPNARYAPDSVRAVRERILGPLMKSTKWPQVYESPLPAELHQTTWITDLALDYLERRVDDPDGSPFFCFVSYVDPHDPYDPPEPYSRMFHSDDMPDPLPAAWREKGNAVLEEGRAWNRFDSIASDNTAVRQWRAHYHGSIKFIDDQIARIAAFVEQRGLLDDTIIVFTTDHGDMLGDHELTTKGERPYDAGIRCPLIVTGGGVHPHETDRLTCTLDFMPTFCDWAGVPEDLRPGLEGRSFAPLCASGEENGHDSVQVSFGRMETIVSDDGWRLTVYDDDHAPGEMVNLREDPDEQHNRYDDPTCAERRSWLFEAMIRRSIGVRMLP
jgi:arylsulfatase